MARGRRDEELPSSSTRVQQGADSLHGATTVSPLASFEGAAARSATPAPTMPGVPGGSVSSPKKARGTTAASVRVLGSGSLRSKGKGKGKGKRAGKW